MGSMMGRHHQTTMTKPQPGVPVPSDEQFDRWEAEWRNGYPENPIGFCRYVADKQLRLCVEWLKKEAMSRSWQTVSQLADEMQAAMRPNPPSLKQQALDQLDKVVSYAANVGKVAVTVDTIRRAIESLPD